jgi:dihydrofolate reductase
MRKLTGAVFQSLDGVMQAPGGPEEDPTGGFALGGWSFAFWDGSMQQPFGKIIEADYDLLLGKRTYDIFAGFWPYNQDNPVGERFQRIDKYVLTHSDEPLRWENSHRISGDTAEAVSLLKQTDGRDLLIQGSSTLYPPLLSAGLIDRLLLMTFPVLLGRGKSIFDGMQEPGRMKLTDHFVSDSGVAFATYEPAGEVPIGSFATGEPSQEERGRREKMREGSW